MTCRCGHGRHTHQPTQKGRRGFAERQAQRRSRPGFFMGNSGWGPDGTADHIHLPCRTCGCRDWHPDAVKG